MNKPYFRKGQRVKYHAYWQKNTPLYTFGQIIYIGQSESLVRIKNGHEVWITTNLLEAA